MFLIFSAGIEQAEFYPGCVLVSVLIHYFTLVSILWMSAEALLMFQKLVFVFKKITTKFIIMVSLLCWCKCMAESLATCNNNYNDVLFVVLPLIPVLITLVVDLASGNEPSTDYVVRRNTL